MVRLETHCERRVSPLTPERVLFILLSACAAIPPSRVSKQRRSSASGDAPLVPHWPNCAAVLIHAAPSACLAFRSEAEQRELGSIALLKPNERTANAINAVSLMKCTQSASDQQWEAERSVSKAGTLLCPFRHYKYMFYCFKPIATLQSSLQDSLCEVRALLLTKLTESFVQPCKAERRFGLPLFNLVTKLNVHTGVKRHSLLYQWISLAYRFVKGPIGTPSKMNT